METAPTPQTVAHASEVYALRAQVECLAAEVVKYKALMRKSEKRAKRTWRELQKERENSLALAQLVRALASTPGTESENHERADAVHLAIRAARSARKPLDGHR